MWCQLAAGPDDTVVTALLRSTNEAITDPLEKLQLLLQHEKKKRGIIRQTMGKTKINDDKLILKTWRWKTQACPSGKNKIIFLYSNQKQH